jgi:hypothetical protein
MVRKTVLNIRKKYYWKGMYPEVEKFISRCHFCLRNASVLAEHRFPMSEPVVATRPWEVVGVDILGPYILPNREQKVQLL